RQEQLRQERLLKEVKENEVQERVRPTPPPWQGLAAGSFLLAGDLPEGDYTLTVREARQRFPEQQRHFQGRRYRQPSHQMELQFARKAYRPGDEVEGQGRALRRDGKGGYTEPVKDRPVLVSIQVDGKLYGPSGRELGRPFTLFTDQDGNMPLR